MYRELIAGFSLSILSGLTVSPSMAVEDEVRGLMLIIEQRVADPAARQEAMRAGSNRALLCSYCHGRDGNSVKPEVPNLAGQNPVYLLDQINKFARGERENFVMNSLARDFTLDDKVNLAIYYANQEVRQQAANEQLAETGRHLYTQQCASCHGRQGRGTTEYARLAGQQPEYVKMTLTRFRNNANSPQADSSSARRSPIMESIVATLSDEQLEALAAYVAGL